MMNCLEFRRLKLAEPKLTREEARAHASECPACLAFARSVDESEAAFGRALAVPVPEGLADRILLRQSGQGRAGRRAYALAASLLLAVAAGVIVATRETDPANPARIAIEHVIEEPQSLTTVYNADPERLSAIVRDFG
jgi:anti-sigma factor RsiW